uniref:Uncharacterized protein n=1 Tax=Arundo donax TaxID=35708 RepID=A0A0A8XU57_ARUDO
MHTVTTFCQTSHSYRACFITRVQCSAVVFFHFIFVCFIVVNLLAIE